MKIIIGGAVATLLGLVGIGVWFDSLLIILKGCVPLALLLGGGLALYLGFDELKDTWKTEDAVEQEPDTSPDDKKRIAELEKEIEELNKK